MAVAKARGIQEFISTVVKQAGGVSASNLYEFTIAPHKKLTYHIDVNGSDTLLMGGGVGKNLFLMQLLCNEIQLPGVTYAGVDVKMPYKGITQKMAGGKVYNELDISFILDSESTPLKFFRSWQDFIMGVAWLPTNYNQVDGPYDRAVQQTYAQSYYDEYCDDITITKLEKTNLTAKTQKANEDYRRGWTARLAKAYPYTVSSIPYSAGPASAVKVSVGFYYEYSHLTYDKGSVRVVPPNTKAQDAIAKNKPYLVKNGVTQNDITVALAEERNLKGKRDYSSYPEGPLDFY